MPPTTDASTSASANLSTLPTELLLSISECISTEKDLNTLTRLTIRLYNLFNDHLYRTHVQKTGSKTLLWAAEQGQQRTIKFLLAHGADITTKSTHQETLFILAAKHGHLDLLQDLLFLNSVDPAEKDDLHRTALSHTCEHGHVRVVTYLLSLKGTDVNQVSYPRAAKWPKSEDNPLRLAAGAGHTKIVKILLATNKLDLAKDLDLSNSSAFTRALTAGHIDIVQILLEQGADLTQVNPLNSGSPLRLAAEAGHTDLVKFLLAAGEIDLTEDLDLHPRSAFFRSITKNHTEVVEIFIARGADPAQRNDKGLTALHYAAQNSCLDVVVYLLSLPGVDPDAISDGYDASTPFTRATVAGDLPIMQILYETGKVDLNFRAGFTRSSPLSIMAEGGRLEVVKWLLSLNLDIPSPSPDRGEKRNVDINIKDHCGQTPLYRACVTGRTEIVSFLLSQPTILPSEPDFRGQRPFMAAIRKGHVEIAHLFLQRTDIDSDFDHEWKGDTPLLVAASVNRESIVEELVKKGVRIDVKDKHLRTPFDYARWAGSNEMERVLEEYARKCRFRERRGVKERVVIMEGGIEGRMAALAEEVRGRRGGWMVL